MSAIASPSTFVMTSPPFSPALSAGPSGTVPTTAAPEPAPDRVASSGVRFCNSTPINPCPALPAAAACSAASRTPSWTVVVDVCPSLTNSKATLVPGGRTFTAKTNCLGSAIVSPLSFVMTSPLIRPAFSAGPPGEVPATRAPELLPSRATNSGVSSRNCTPINPC